MRIPIRTTALAGALVSMTLGWAQAQEVTVMIGGGSFADALMNAYVTPFEKETGIKVNAVRADMPLAKWLLAVETNNVDFDVATISPSSAYQLKTVDGMTPIDYSIYDEHELSGLIAEFRPDWGVADHIPAMVLAYNTDALPEGKRPTSWADFWNVEDFPGTRSLMAPYFSQTSVEEALVADGVPLDQIYPLDLDRAFRKLDEIKPHIRKWWESSSELQQMFNADIVDMALSYDGRITTAKQAGKPLEFTFNGARYYGTYWGIPRGAKNVDAAQKFIEFASRGKNQAALAQVIGYAPANAIAFESMPKELGESFITNPVNLRNAYPMNMEWYAEVGPDGKTNADRVVARFLDWMNE